MRIDLKEHLLNMISERMFGRLSLADIGETWKLLCDGPFLIFASRVSAMQTEVVSYQVYRSFHPSAGWSRWDRHSWRLWEQEPGDTGGCSLHYSPHTGYALQMETHKQTHPPSYFLGQLRGKEWKGNRRNWGKQNRNAQLADTDSETLQGAQESSTHQWDQWGFSLVWAPLGLSALSDSDLGSVYL